MWTIIMKKEKGLKLEILRYGRCSQVPRSFPAWTSTRNQNRLSNIRAVEMIYRFGGRCPRDLEKPFHDEFVEEKREAKLYMNALQDSSMHELSVAFQNAESMLEKGNNIHEEVKRQGTIVKQANRDIEAIEKDIRDTSHRLKGMKSMKNKFKNIVCSKRGGPKGFVVHESDDISFDFTRSYTLPARLPSYDEKMTKQEWINKGVDQLCHVLDEVEHRQEDIGKELGEQEKHFQYLDHNINHVEHKIKNQTKIMSSIRKK